MRQIEARGGSRTVASSYANLHPEPGKGTCRPGRSISKTPFLLLPAIVPITPITFFSHLRPV